MRNAFCNLVLDFRPESILSEQDANSEKKSKITPPYMLAFRPSDGRLAISWFLLSCHNLFILFVAVMALQIAA